MKREWCIPPKGNAEFVCKMEDVLDVYKRPYDANYPVVCMDELSKQQIKEVQTPLPPEPGKPRRFEVPPEGQTTIARKNERAWT